MGEHNPYAAPHSLTVPQPLAPDGMELLARSRVRAVVAILLPVGVLNILLQVRWPFAQVLDNADPHGFAGFLVFVGLAGIVLLLIAAYVLWRSGTRLLAALTIIVHSILGGGTRRDDWITGTFVGTRGWISAATAGAFVWLTFLGWAYFAGGGSWRGYFMAGLLGHLCGATAYLPILLNWLRVRRGQHTDGVQQT